MSLSKKNLDKLNKYKKNRNLNNDTNNINNYTKIYKKDNYSKKLTTEEELYDEFNYLLDE